MLDTLTIENIKKLDKYHTNNVNDSGMLTVLPLFKY